MPVKTAFAGGNAYSRTHHMADIGRIVISYHSNAASEGRRESEQDLDCRIHPLDPFLVGTLTFFELLDPRTKNGENGGGRMARLQLDG
jgi:hypothetical protein